MRGRGEFRRRQGDHSHIPENPLREHVGHATYDRFWVGGISFSSNRIDGERDTIMDRRRRSEMSRVHRLRQRYRRRVHDDGA